MSGSERSNMDSYDQTHAASGFDNISAAERILAAVPRQEPMTVGEIASQARCSRERALSILQTLESFDQILVEDSASNPLVIRNPSISWANRLMQTVVASDSREELLDKRVKLEAEIETLKDEYGVDSLEEFRSSETNPNPGDGEWGGSEQHWEGASWEQCQNHIALLDAALENYEALVSLVDSVPFEIGNPLGPSKLVD